MTAPGLVLQCPHCGGVVLVQPAAMHVSALVVAGDDHDRDRGAVLVLSTSTNKELTKELISTSTSPPAPLEQGTLPLPPALAKTPLLTWKRALAIAHKAIEQWPDSAASQAETFKELCAHQGIAYAEPGTDGRPLYARALDYALEMRRRRGGRGTGTG